MTKAIDSIDSRGSFSVVRRVKWSECDPAGVVYTGVFPEYVLTAADEFYGYLYGSTAAEMKMTLDIELPTSAMEFSFRRPLYPDQSVEMLFKIGDIGERTFQLLVNGICEDRQLAFESKITPICIERNVRKSKVMPDELRLSLEYYRAASEKL